MASTVKAKTWLRGKVKAVLSGDTLVIMEMASTTSEIPREKTITLSSLMAPRLARQDRSDEPFAWQSREFLRNLCIGKEVLFQVDYSSKGREFGTVCLGDKYIAFLVVEQGWAKVWEVKQQDKDKGEFSPHLKYLLRLEDQAKKQGVGRWNKAPGASRYAVRNLPPSAVGDPNNFYAKALLDEYKGLPIEAFVENVRDGSTIRVYMLPGYQFVQVFIAGIRAPSMGKKEFEPEKTSSETNGKTSNGHRGPLTSAQKVTGSSESVTKGAPDPFGRESKHFTEARILHRYVQISLTGVDEFSNLIGSVYYTEREQKNLAVQLVENGLAKYVNWSANMLHDYDKQRLKSLELEAKKSQLRMWTNYTPPPTNSRAIHDQNFTGKVVEIINGDCIVVADDSLPFASPLAEKRVNLSSIRCPRLVNDRSEAKDFLRKHLIGHQVHVSLEYQYSRKLNIAEGPGASTRPAAADRVMDFGSVFLESPSKKVEDASLAPPSAGNQNVMTNIAEMIVARGFAEVIRHRDFDVRSNHYDALLAAESRAKAAKRGMHSGKVAHVTDQAAPSKRTKDLLPCLQRKRITAVVEYIFSGHRYKLYIPKETCYIAFSLSGVRCPGRNGPYFSEAIALMRSKMMQRNVEIEIETIDRYETFLGSLWESESNVAMTLLEYGLATLQTSLKEDRIPDFPHLVQAEKSAKRKKLKIWENYAEGQEVSNGQAIKIKQKEELQVVVTEVLGGGKFYVQLVGDQKVASIQQELASLKLQEAPLVNGSFNPKKCDLVLAKFSGDNSWYRAMIVNTPGGAIGSLKDKFEVFYIDYGNQEVVAYSQLRPLDSSVSSSPGLAQLCCLAYVKVPSLEEDYGKEAAFCLFDHILHGQKEFKAIIEDRDTSGGKGKGQGTGTSLVVTLVDTEAELSINAVMLKKGLARLVRRRGPAERKQTIDELEEYQEEARYERLGIWEYGDNMSDDDKKSPARKAGGKR